MIHVDRGQVDPPARLVAADGAGVEETRKVLEFFADPANLQAKFEKHKQYSHPEVKDLLIRLFRGKCAYCEGSVSGGHDGDVEHFRPKGAIEVAGRSVKPGYYWLAATWENLYLSCMHCNQKRKHRVEGGEVLTAGKSDKFPVADEAGRVTAADLPADLLDGGGALDLERLKALCRDEARLLLDPCHDDPHQHLVFHEDGMVVATLDPGGDPDPRGDASIRTFGLHRPQLVNDRATELVKIQNDLDLVRMALEGLDQDPGNQLARQLLEGLLAKLETHCNPDQRFSGMARQIVDRKLEEMLG